MCSHALSSSNSVIKTVTVGANPGFMVYNSMNKDVYLNDIEGASVSVLNKDVATVEVGSIPEGIAYNPSNKEVHLTNEESDTVFVLS